MNERCGRPRSAPRVHAIILTRDRTDVLARCVENAISTMRPTDVLTVLDDSCKEIVSANRLILGAAARRSITKVTHLPVERAHDVIRLRTGGPKALWQRKTAPRDIAPLRNLSLLVSWVIGAHTTVLIDDDVYDFDLDTTQAILDAVEGGAGGAVVGAEIRGTSEQDTITRLSDAMSSLDSNIKGPASVEDLFRALPGSYAGGEAPDRCVSAGYMAFRLPPARLLAFPPGYNEDWLWCLLLGARGDTAVVRSRQSVIHAPPTVRQPTRADILFELAGDLVLDCLAERSDAGMSGPSAPLEELSWYLPDPSALPLARADALRKQVESAWEDRRRPVLHQLQSYGLAVVEEMRRSGDLAMDARGFLRAWSADATARARSFSATLGSAGVRIALGAMVDGGTL